MASVTITLPVHNEFATNRIRWQDTVAGLGDVAVLLETAGTGVLQRFQINANGADNSNRIQLRTGATAGESINASGPLLNTDWGGRAAAVVLQVPGLNDLSVGGPTQADIAEMDTTEPYAWAPGDDYTTNAISYLSQGGQELGLVEWVSDFKSAYAADNTVRATLILNDGQGVQSYAVNAGGVSWVFDVPEPTVIHTLGPRAYAVDAGGVSWVFNVPEPTVTHIPFTQAHAVDAGGVAWLFEIPEPTVTYTARTPDVHAVDAGGVAWSFVVSQPTVTHVSEGGDRVAQISRTNVIGGAKDDHFHVGDVFHCNHQPINHSVTLTRAQIHALDSAAIDLLLLSANGPNFEVLGVYFSKESGAYSGGAAITINRKNNADTLVATIAASNMRSAGASSGWATIPALSGTPDAQVVIGEGVDVSTTTAFTGAGGDLTITVRYVDVG